MSVLSKNYSKVYSALKVIENDDKIINIVENNKYFKEYNEKSPFKSSTQDYLGRAFWYAYVSNQVAYALQYEERNVDFFKDFDDETEPEFKLSLIEAYREIGSLHYNMFTNDGNYFMMIEYYSVFQEVYKYTSKEEKLLRELANIKI